MKSNKSSGMTMVGVVVFVAVLVLMIQTDTTSAARPNGVLPPALPTVQAAATSDVPRPRRPRAAPLTSTDKVVHVACPTSDVHPPVPASVNTDKVKTAAATSDAVLLPQAVKTPGPPKLVHLAPGTVELARVAASKNVALDVIVGGP